MYVPNTIRTKDGRNIGIRIYAAENENASVVIIAPSAEKTQSFYFNIAVFFLQHGFSVITFDYRGVGESAPVALSRYRALLRQWAMQDMDAVLRYAKNQFPKQELIFIGHGIGGEIIGLAPASQYINRLIVVNCALSCSRLRRGQDRIWIGFMKIFVQTMSWLFGYFPGKYFGIYNNLPRGVMYEWIHWCNNTNGLFDEFPDHNYRKLKIPLLAFSFTDDWRSQQKGVKALLEHFSEAGITWYHLQPGQAGQRRVGHSGFFKKAAQSVLWPVMMSWLQNEKNEKNGINTINHKTFEK
jgi:predicted alpha/beta hydrolase